MQTYEKNVVCASCDAGCLLRAKVSDGRVVKIMATDVPLLRENICMKGVYAPKSLSHPDRILFPLRRRGKRGADDWQRVSWDDALDEIAERLKKVVAKHGPESLAVATSQWNTCVDYGTGRRFMNLLGSPNWISGVAMCAGNTAAINRMVYGWFPVADYAMTNCIVLFGHNPQKHSWTPFYNQIRAAQQRGAKLIVIDPRKSESAKRADLWLPIRVGTDAAICLSWVNVIIEEGLFDQQFVQKWTVGFDQLRERAKDYEPSVAAEITGISPELIRESARLYAKTSPAVIPWTPITDQQVSSTSAIRLHCILRSITGNLDVAGGDVFYGFPSEIINETEIERHDLLPEKQKAKQLGSSDHPAFTYRGTHALREPTRKVWGVDYANLVYGSYMANPTAVFKAMADETPYPVKAFFSLGNNSLMGYANMKRIQKGILNQDLIVVHEHFKTPTAQLADFILPGDSWLERPHLFDAFGIGPFIQPSEQAMNPPGACRDVYDFWKQLAIRFDFEEQFPWPNLKSLLDYRLEPMNLTFDEFAERYQIYFPKQSYQKYRKKGFATPSGRVELFSSVLSDLGFDPLPYYREPPPVNSEFPLNLFIGVRDGPFFQTGHRHVPELRERCRFPTMFISPRQATKSKIENNIWVKIETEDGEIYAITEFQDEMPEDLVRVPHGWWFPESKPGIEELSGSWSFSDAQITSDRDELLDREQGIPHLKGIPCRVGPASPPELQMIEEILEAK